MSKSGRFSPDGKKYVVARPDTPKPWINMLSNDSYSSVRTHLGDRVLATHPRPNHPNSCIYVHEVETGRVWSLNWQPVNAPLQKFEATIGFGYTRIKIQSYHLESTITYFVPRDGTDEIAMVNLTNRGTRSRTLRIYTYDSWQNAGHHTHFQNHTLMCDDHKSCAYVFANIPADGFEVLPQNFFGPDKTEIPAMVVSGSIPQNIHNAGSAIAVLCFEVQMKAGETVEFDYLSGVALNANDAGKVRQRYITRAAVQKALDDVFTYWNRQEEELATVTDDPLFNTTFEWSRYQALMKRPQHTIITFQERYDKLMAVLPYDIETAKVALQDLLVHQSSNGQCVLSWDTRHKTGAISNTVDLMQWLASACIAYVNETGDLQYLDAVTPFYDGGKASVLEHIFLAMERTMQARTARGLLASHLAQVGDKQHTESTVIAGLTCWNIRGLLPILSALGKHDLAQQWREQYHTLADALNQYAWDGGWYQSGTDASGKPTGSYLNKYEMIHLPSQAWAVISHIADVDASNTNGVRHHRLARGQQAFAAVTQKLMTKDGPALTLPPKPGREAIIDTTAAAWAAMAQCLMGEDQSAYELWQMVSPQIRSLNHRFEEEPYFYQSHLAGPSSKNYGEALVSESAEAATWWHKVMLENILGVQATLPGLVLNPCVPKHWPKWNVVRHFRGAWYEIEFTNPHHLSSGVQEIRFDKKMCLGNVIPDFRDGKTHRIKVTLMPEAIEQSPRS